MMRQGECTMYIHPGKQGGVEGTVGEKGCMENREDGCTTPPLLPPCTPSNFLTYPVPANSTSLVPLHPSLASLPAPSL